jgi:5-methylcytosine-specific restriction endonuclease McrA
MPRRFSSKQRLVLRLASLNRCRGCGDLLNKSFHADHVKPWSKGGETETDNGQALCAACNLQKGADDAPVPGNR